MKSGLLEISEWADQEPGAQRGADGALSFALAESRVLTGLLFLSLLNPLRRDLPTSRCDSKSLCYLLSSLVF